MFIKYISEVQSQSIVEIKALTLGRYLGGGAIIYQPAGTELKSFICEDDYDDLPVWCFDTYEIAENAYNAICKALEDGKQVFDILPFQMQIA